MTETAAAPNRVESDLRFVTELTKKAIGLESVDEFWPIIEKSLVEYFGCDRATLYLVDKTELRSMFARGMEKGVVVKLGDGIAGMVGLQGKPITVNQPYSDPRFNPAYDRISGYKTESLACAAFVHDSQAVGVVELLNKPGGFTEDDARSLTLFSPHIGFAIAKLRSDQKNRELQARLSQVAKMATLGTLVGGVVHEIGSPLTAIEAAVEGLQRGLPPEGDQYTRLEQLRVQVLRCQRITRNLLDFTRRSDFALKPVSASAALEATIALADHQARLNSVTLEAHGSSEIPDVMAAEDQLQQVFLNLITNALQAMPHGGKLTVSWDSVGENVDIHFKDTGEGIDPGDLPQIFEPFFTTRAKGMGTGLGLSICRDLVERFGGKLLVDSAGKGQGATFTVRLPRAR